MSQNGGILTKNQLRDSVPRCIVRRCRGVEGWRRARSKRSAPASGEGRGLRGWGFDIPWWSLVPRHPSAKKGLAVVSRGTLSRSAMLRRARSRRDLALRDGNRTPGLSLRNIMHRRPRQHPWKLDLAVMLDQPADVGRADVRPNSPAKRNTSSAASARAAANTASTGGDQKTARALFAVRQRPMSTRGIGRSSVARWWSRSCLPFGADR